MFVSDTIAKHITPHVDDILIPTERRPCDTIACHIIYAIHKYACVYAILSQKHITPHVDDILIPTERRPCHTIACHIIYAIHKYACLYAILSQNTLRRTLTICDYIATHIDPNRKAPIRYNRMPCISSTLCINTHVCMRYYRKTHYAAR